MTYQAKDSAVYGEQLRVQEVSVGFTSSLYTASGSTVTIQINETISEVSSALFIDDSAGTVAPVAFANRAISGTTVTLTLSAAFAIHDEIVLRYSTVD